MKKENLRHIIITYYDDGGINTIEIKGYFHKWFEQNIEGINRLYAIVENENGNIKMFDLDQYNIRFLTDEEIKEKNSQGWE